MRAILNDIKFWKKTVLEALQTRAEYNFLDFKSKLSRNNDRLKEHINAFGNYEIGGCFVFGVKSFSPIDVKDDWDSIIQKITHLAKDTQEPALSVKNFSVKTDAHRLLCIYIEPSQTKPVFIKDRAPLGGEACFKRSGSSTITMSVQEIRDLLAQSSDNYYDESVVKNANLEQLDFLKLKTLISKLEGNDIKLPTNISILMDNRILCGLKIEPKVTVAGWFCFAKLPQEKRIFKNAYIEFQIFHGLTRETPIKKHEIAGTLPDQIEASINLLLQYVWIVPKIQGIRRQDIPAYSKETLREVITNSIVHKLC